MNLKHLTLALPFIFSLTACQDEQKPTVEVEKKTKIIKITDNKQELKTVTAGTLNENKAEFKTLITNKECDTSNQCQVIAVGNRACGGPSQYAIYSNKHVDSEQVKTLASHITVAEKIFNEKNKMMSICQHLEKPAAQCISNICTKILQGGDIY